MRFTLIILVIISVLINTITIIQVTFGHVRTKRIINGEDGDRFQPASHVTLEIHDGTDLIWCGGTLISEYYVLTAGHCIDDEYDEIVVIMGDPDYTHVNRTVRIHANDTVVHPEHYSTFNDIGVVQLSRPAPLTGPNIRLASLPRYAHAHGHAQVYQLRAGYICGVGYVDDPVMVRRPRMAHRLQCMPTIVDALQCAAHNLTVLPTELCMFGLGWFSRPCTGDSGGGFMLDESRGGGKGGGTQMVAGIVMLSFNRCDPLQPFIFTRVASHLDWITETTGVVAPP